ncbi:unnamed protein product [Sphagnum balticum]
MVRFSHPPTCDSFVSSKTCGGGSVCEALVGDVYDLGLEACHYGLGGEELETEKQDWSNGGSYSGQSPNPPRSLHTATCVGEKIVVFGGQEDNSAKNDVFIFDTVAERW